MRGTPDAPQGFGDWKIINKIARDKLLRVNRHVYANCLGGQCINLKTREEYSEEDLIRLFHLTRTEAESCFMTLDK